MTITLQGWLQSAPRLRLPGKAGGFHLPPRAPSAFPSVGPAGQLQCLPGAMRAPCSPSAYGPAISTQPPPQPRGAHGCAKWQHSVCVRFELT